MCPQAASGCAVPMYNALELKSRRFSELIRGKRAMTPDTALRLARVVGMSAEFWLGLQMDWDLWHAGRDKNVEEISRLIPLQTTA